MVELVLDGSIPSKKNSRINLRSGVSIPSTKFTQWQDKAIWQVRQQTRERFFDPVHVDATIYFGTKVRADLDNRMTSILDMLVDALVLRDDKWQDVPKLTVSAEYRKGKPGAYIRISELPQIGKPLMVQS
jgi:Holliday junction resolvase RusA-like endonuclease